MSQFKASLLDISGNVSVQTDATGTILQITDSSNYTTNSESGHAPSDFSVGGYRKYIVTAPSLAVFIMAVSGVIPQNATISPGGANDVVNYTVTEGDGVYQIQLETVPNYNAAANYQANDDCVYHAGILYKCTLNTPSPAGAFSLTYFTAITDVLLPTKYTDIQKVGVVTDINNGCIGFIRDAFCVLNETGCGDCLSDEAQDTLDKAVKLRILIEQVGNSASKSNWNEVITVINLCKTIINS